MAVFVLFFGSVAAGGSQADNPDNPSSAVPQRSNTTVKIMPLGDSITESNKGLNSYRYYLWHLLLDQGYHIDFVGSQHGVGNGPPANPDFDMDHEGHAGWRADEILTRSRPGRRLRLRILSYYILEPTISPKGKVSPARSTTSGGIIDALRTVNPRIQILLAQLIAKTGVPSIAVLNGNLPALVADKKQAESPIVLVDQYTGFDPSTMTYDGTHPNAIGDSHMADRWFEKLAPMLDAFLTQPGPEAGQGRP